ncbi:MAG TPA: hypothetical protein VMY77_16590 [Chitinophagaceae bacterium]|nr:hypothetical protein [Chitinophagaceae bacterium]
MQILLSKRVFVFVVSLIIVTFSINVKAQTCSGGKILISRGCGCTAVKNSSKCVNPSQVQHYLNLGWYLGPRTFDCCLGLAKPSSSKDAIAKRGDINKKRNKIRA